MRVWAVVMLAALGACGSEPERRACWQLGWTCGVDDYGASCGRCGPSSMCVANVCRFREECRCGGQICGMDACGVTLCGTCPAGESCTSGHVCR